MRLLCTVGSTRFDELVAVVSGDEFARAARQRGVTHVKLQYGQGPEPALDALRAAGIDSEAFSFRPGFRSEVEWADWIIGHAGAGTALDALRCGKALVVVINERLMDNHQEELADALAAERYVLKARVHSVVDVLRSALGKSDLRPWPEPQRGPLFGALDSLTGAA